MAKIFCWAKLAWFKLPTKYDTMKNLTQKFFSQWSISKERTFTCRATRFTRTYGKKQWELDCPRELQNTHDRYAVAVEKNCIVIGHLLRKVAHVCLLFLKPARMNHFYDS